MNAGKKTKIKLKLLKTKIDLHPTRMVLILFNTQRLIHNASSFSIILDSKKIKKVTVFLIFFLR